VNPACRAAQRSASFEHSDPSIPATMRACPPDPFIDLLALSLTASGVARAPVGLGQADSVARLAADDSARFIRALGPARLVASVGKDPPEWDPAAGLRAGFPGSGCTWPCRAAHRSRAAWRRVVPSPEPAGLVELPLIRILLERGVIVVCAGSGGIPVMAPKTPASR